MPNFGNFGNGIVPFDGGRPRARFLPPLCPILPGSHERHLEWLGRSESALRVLVISVVIHDGVPSLPNSDRNTHSCPPGRKGDSLFGRLRPCRRELSANADRETRSGRTQFVKHESRLRTSVDAPTNLHEMRSSLPSAPERCAIWIHVLQIACGRNAF